MPPLARQVIAFPFAGGVDQKTGKPHVAPTRLLSATNCRQQKTGEIRMRPTNGAYPRDLANGGSLSSATELASHDGKLVLRSGTELYSYDAIDDAWVLLGTGWRVAPTVTPLVNDSVVGTSSSIASAASMDSAVGGGYLAVTYLLAGAVYAEIFELTSMLSVSGRLPLYNSGTAGQVPKVVATSDRFVFFWVEEGASSSTLRARYATFANPDSLGSTATVSSSLMGSSGSEDGAVYDVQRAGPSLTNITVATVEESGGTYSFQLRTWSGLTMSTVTGPVGTNFAADPDATIGLLEHDYSDTRLYLAVGTTGGGGMQKMTVYRINSSTLSTVSTSGDCASAATVPYAVCGFYDTGTTSFTVFTECSVSGALQIVRAVGDFSSIVSSTYIRGVGLASKTFKFSSAGSRCLMLANYSYNSAGSGTFQNAYFVVDETMKILARVLYGNAGGLLHGGGFVGTTSSRTNLPAWSQVSADKYITVGQRAVDIEANTIEYGVAAIQVEYGSTAHAPWRSAYTGIEAAGVVRSFDGRSATEVGFHVFPQIPVLTPSAGGGLTASSTYYYALCFAWTDKTGALFRSASVRADSNGAAVSVATGVGEGTVTLDIPTTGLSDKTLRNPWSVAEIEIEIYRTTANDPETYYMVGKIQNSVAANTVQYVDTAADSAITSNEPLYDQTDGEVSNESPPPALDCAVWNNRTWIISAENPREIWYSKEMDATSGVAFNDLFKVLVDAPAVAIIGMDDKFVIFTSEGGAVLSGDGPDAQGSGLYARPQSFAGIAGCSNRRSVVLTPEGVIRMTSKGLWLLTRGLSDEYIGGPVEDTAASGTIMAAQVHPSKEQVAFYTSAGTTMVYDLFHKQWYTDTDQAAVGAAVWSGYPFYVAGNGTVYVDNGSIDPTPPWTMTVESAWIQLGNILGYQRVWSLSLLGEYRGAFRLSCSVYFDHEQANPEVHRVNSIDIKRYAVGDPFVVLLPIRRQQCTAIKVQITVTPVAGTGETLRLTGLAIEAGVIPGRVKRTHAESAYNRGN